MACTGELPPNTRSGQNFIHDPKVAGETEVKAQIKLRFFNASQIPFIVVRSFQLTQKAASLQFKALDSTIQTLDPETGQMQALPQRCADINVVVPVFMGVSKAILENVIFVHQEESNWPLAEGVVLKKKFDDIFSATKYTKAMDELKKIRKGHVDKAKDMRLELSELKAKKDTAARLRAAVAEGTERASKLQREIDDLLAKVDECVVSRRDIDQKLTSMADFGDDIVSLKARYDLLAAKNAETYARLMAAYSLEDVEMPESELQECERDFSSNIAQAVAEEQRLARELQAAQLQLEALRSQGDKESHSLGRLQAESEAHARNLEERDRFLRQVCVETGAAVPPGSTNGDGRLSPEALSTLMQAFESQLDSARNAVDAARQSHRADDDIAGRAIDEVATQISAVAEGLRMKQDTVRANEAKINNLQMQLDAEPGVNKHALEAARSRVSAKSHELEARENELKSSSLDEERRRLTEEMASLASKADSLRLERKGLAAAAEEASRMNFKAQELEAALGKISEHLDRHRHKLMWTLDAARAEDLPEPGQALVSAVRAVAEQRRLQYESAASELKSAQAHKSAAEGNLQATRTQLQKLNSELSNLSARLQAGTAGTAGQSVGATLETLEKEVKNKEMISNRSDVFAYILKHHVDIARSKNKCGMCSRPFSSPAECSAFVSKKEKELNDMPSQTELVREELKVLEQRMQALKLLEPVAARHDSLKDNDLPALEQRVKDLEKEVSGLQDAVDAAARAEKSTGDAMQEAQDVLQDAALPLARLATEASERRSEVESLRSTIQTENASRSVTAVDAELAELESHRARVESSKEAAATKLGRLRDAVSALRTELHREREDVLRLSTAVEKRAALESQKAELVAANDSMIGALIEGRKASAPLEQRRSTLQRQRDDARAVARAEESELEDVLRKFQTQQTQLEARERALREYEQRGAAAALTKAEERLASIRQRQGVEDQRCIDLSIRLADKRSAVADSEAFQHQVADLLAYRRSKAQEASLAADLDRAGAALAAVGDRGALQNESRAFAAKEQEFRSEADRAAGALETVQETAENAAEELADPDFDDIDGKHRRKLIEARTTEMASGDLEKFQKALERALLSFHTTKMSEINKIIKELWQKTYRNSDIDYIQIRADESGSANRSYNYRVVMVCSGAELDMRGRCSAGQRVLASLIIRLALAETFCLNCGILALDEPTTNLDSENASSLADALKNIMLARKDQENFQLVVITHDEAFARRIGTREHAEYMWRITKDDSQHSTLTKEDILE